MYRAEYQKRQQDLQRASYMPRSASLMLSCTCLGSSFMMLDKEQFLDRKVPGNCRVANAQSSHGAVGREI